MWNNRNVWIILIGEFIAGTGLWIGIIGNLEFMQEKVPSDFMKSLILAIGLLAGIIAGPIAGKIIDQSRKKTVMVYAGFFRMVSVLFMFIAINTGNLGWMIIFLITLQISAAFYFPALQSAIPLIVQENELLQLNGVHMNVATLARIIGTALGGAMLVFMSLSMLYLSSLIAYFLLFLFTFLLQIDEKAQPVKMNKTKNDSGGFKEVLPVIKNMPVVLMTLFMTIIPLLFLGGFNLIVINISEIYNDSSVKGLIYTTEGLSFMLGAFLVKRISLKWSPYSILFFFSFLTSIAQMILFFVEIKFLLFLAFAVFGFAIGCIFPTAATIFQTKIPKEYHGRFFSFRNMLDRISFQVVLLGSGFLLDVIGMQKMVFIYGIVSAALTLYFYLKYRSNQFSERKKAQVV